jgi:uncharacterized protein (DUF1697 family)
MPQYIAFLRGMNLGNRRVKMDELAKLFVQLKYTDVATFIASGNVIFTAKAADDAKLAEQIQAHLAKKLGYEVDTFVRTRAEVAAVAAFQPFAKADMEHEDHTIHVGFLAAPLPAAQAKAFEACRTEVDEVKVNGREYYWLCRIKSNESKLWTSKEFKAVKLPSSSMRNVTTVRKLAGLYPVL